MQQYLDLVRAVLSDGSYKPNRTGVDTISLFGQYYEIDLGAGYPLLTTKRMDGYRWNSLLYELLWYLSGEEHVRTLREHTGIWDEWADAEGRLDTAYGRFWRRFPIPAARARLDGETWAEEGHRWVNDDERTFDQLRYVIDQLRENPHSRRLIVTAWHPANAAVSTLPPCHYTFVFSVQGDRLNCHLTQRSGDVALGIPFNIAAYALLTTVVAGRTGFEPGTFAHTVVDAHVYCGTGERGHWYAEHLGDLQERLGAVGSPEEYPGVGEWIAANAPAEEYDGNDDSNDGDAGYDHVPGLLEQLSREPYDRPAIEVTDRPIDELTVEDIRLRDYEAHPSVAFAVAE